jgi:hypothetical protein
MMDIVLAGIKWQYALVYLDDIIIYSRTWRDHIQHLEEVFQRLDKANLKCNPEKCELMKTKVKFLGHTISKEGIATNPKKIDAIKNIGTPISKAEVHTFLGIANYYRKFIMNFAIIATPLYNLIKHNTVFSWDDRCEKAFQEIKNRLMTAPILAHPDFNLPFEIHTDASMKGIGAILTQTQDTQEKAIWYASRKLTNAEQK